MERVQKVIANNGYCSKRKAEELILKGKVKVIIIIEPKVFLNYYVNNFSLRNSILHQYLLMIHIHKTYILNLSIYLLLSFLHYFFLF